MPLPNQAPTLSEMVNETGTFCPLAFHKYQKTFGMKPGLSVLCFPFEFYNDSYAICRCFGMLILVPHILDKLVSINISYTFFITKALIVKSCTIFLQLGS
jgi:hypothetical protein